MAISLREWHRVLCVALSTKFGDAFVQSLTTEQWLDIIELARDAGILKVERYCHIIIKEREGTNVHT